MPFAWLLIASALQTPTFSAVRQHTYDLEYSSVGVGYMTRGSLFVGLMDDATVVELRTNGERRNWGRRGTGPGEFRSPHLVGVLADTLWVADYSAARITVLGKDTTVYPLLTTDLIGGTRAYFGAGVTLAAGRTAGDYRMVSSQAGVIATGTKPDIASVVLGATEMEGMLRMQSPYSKGMLLGYDLPRRMVVVLERGEDSYSVAWYDALTGTRVHAVSYTRARERTPRGLTDAIARMHYENEGRSQAVHAGGLP